MLIDFDPGYGKEPFRTLCREYPDETVFPRADFRVEWGPIFHRGRLGGTARVLVIGQDPAAHETIVRRALVGAAGRRVQGFLRKLGITRRYTIINAFLYSVYGQHGGERHRNDAGIAAYRNRWLDALLIGTSVEAVVSLGSLADSAWQSWKQTPAGAARQVTYARITHPTQPESSSRTSAERATATQVLLQNWNAVLAVLYPAITRRDIQTPLVPYATTWQPGDLVPIPARDFPAGLPPWMRSGKTWAVRSGDTAADKRRRITITIPAGL